MPDGCGVRVGGVSGAWREGRCIVFDDSFRHDVWNDSDRRRVVLVLDLWHPDLSEDEVALLAGLHRYGAANGASARQRYWARNDAALARAQERAAPSPAPPAPADGRRREPALGGERPRARIGAALRAGDLRARRASVAARYAELCRGTRWYPVRRDDDPALPALRPVGPALTPAKLLHDIEQIEYLQARGVVGDDLTPGPRAATSASSTPCGPSAPNARVPLVGAARAEVGHVYNRIVHVRPTPRVDARPLPRVGLDTVEEAYLDRRPNMAVIDDFLYTGGDREPPPLLPRVHRLVDEPLRPRPPRAPSSATASTARSSSRSPKSSRAALPRVIGDAAGSRRSGATSTRPPSPTSRRTPISPR